MLRFSATLVIGATGMIGHSVAARLHSLGVKVIGIDIKAPRTRPDFYFTLGDLTDSALLASLIVQHDIKCLVHAGGYSGPMLSQNDPREVMDVNVMGLLSALEAARAHDIHKVVWYSSILAYGNQADFSPVAESRRLTPDTVYGATKAAGESLLSAYASTYGIDAFALRPTGVYGPGRTTPCFIRYLIEHALRSEACVINNSPALGRQFIHVDDVVEATVLALMSSGKTGFQALNISDGEVWTVEAVVQAARGHFSELQTQYSEHVAPVGGFAVGPLSNQAAYDVLGWRPKITLKDGIATYARFVAASI